MGWGDIGAALVGLAFGGKGDSGLQQTTRVMQQSASARTGKDVPIAMGKFDARPAVNPILQQTIQTAFDVSGHIPNARTMSRGQFETALGTLGINIGVSATPKTMTRTKASMVPGIKQEAIS